MALTQTHELIHKYGNELRMGTIPDDRLRALLASGVFKKSSGYVDLNKPVTDANHSVLDAMKDFVQNLGESSDQDTLHLLISRMLSLMIEDNNTGFMNNNSLLKTFLAYEFAHYAELAWQHVDTGPFQQMLKANQSSCDHVMEVLLMPLVTYFKGKPIDNSASPIITLARGHDDSGEELPVSAMSPLQAALLQKITDYLTWRKNKGGDDGRGYQPGWFTRIRHFSDFGKNRATELQQELQGAGPEGVVALIRGHLAGKNSKLHNHSLDSYLLEAILEHPDAFGLDDIASAPRKTGIIQTVPTLRNSVSRAAFREKILGDTATTTFAL